MKNSWLSATFTVQWLDKPSKQTPHTLYFFSYVVLEITTVYINKIQYTNMLWKKKKKKSHAK